MSGFEKVIEKVCGDKYPKDGPIIWINMRQEPIIYINGDPICARPPNKIGEYAELGNVTRASVKADEEEVKMHKKQKTLVMLYHISLQFCKVLEGRAKENNKIKIVDVGRNEKEIEIKEIKTLHSVMEVLKEKYPGLTHNRVPVCNSAAPLEADFDTISNCLLETNVNCPVIVNCQVLFSVSLVVMHIFYSLKFSRLV